MQPPPLKLVMVKGPREGETLEFRSGSTVRIGRLVRGNNVPIKDSGISSKHLLIGSDSGKWTIQDLDSSNGTALNASTVPPLQPLDLRDGDIIKLGESTSILVQINAQDETSQLRRSRRGQANESDKTESVAQTRGRRAGARNKQIQEKVELEEDNVQNFERSPVIAENRRRGRPRKARVLDKQAEIPDESENVVPTDSQPLNLRVTRSRKNEGNCVILDNVGVDFGEVGIENKRTRGGGRKRNNLQKSQQENPQADAVESKENKDLGLNLEEEQEKSNLVDISMDNEKAFENMKEKDNMGRLGPAENNKYVLGFGNLKESEDGNVQGNTSARFEESKGTLNSDIETMTLGEWFDYMEVYMPKQILEATEEMIKGMRRKAALVQDCMINQKKDKSVLTVGQ